MKKIYFILFIGILLLSSCSGQTSYQKPLVKGSNVIVDVSSLRPDIPAFYTYSYLGKKINFFVISVNGKVVSFLDACENCHPAKLGYRFEEGYLICRHCNVKYPVSEIKKGIGGCFPIPVTGHIQNGQYLIHVSMLEKMADKF